MSQESFLITSAQNPRIKRAVKMRDRRERDESGCFLIEGYRELLRAVDAGVAVETLFICHRLFLGTNERSLISRAEKAGAEVLECPDHLFQKLSYRDRPDGLVAIAKQMKRSLADLEAIVSSKKSPLLVVAEAIEKPGNLGTILRSSDAAGVDALIVCDRCTDIHNPNVVRASVGTLFTVPVIEMEGKALLQWLKDRKVHIVAATPAAKVNFTDANLTGPVAIVMGTEQFGLSEKWMEGADIQVRIPMHGEADSLNVAMATTLLLYEVVRQRAKKAS